MLQLEYPIFVLVLVSMDVTGTSVVSAWLVVIVVVSASKVRRPCCGVETKRSKYNASSDGTASDHLHGTQVSVVYVVGLHLQSN